MDYFLTEEQEMIKDLARQIAQERILPIRAKLDEEETFPWDIMEALAQADLFGLIVPEEYGGLGGGTLESAIAIEELARVCAGITTTYSASGLGTYPIILSGSEEQKKKYLPDIASGKHLAAFAVTESNAGSDASNVRTTAVKDGDHYVLNGTKQWITNGGEAHIYTVIAMTDRSKGARGASAFILEKGDPGFEFGKKKKKMGFNDCRIPADRLIAKEGQGFIVTMKTFDRSRPGIGAAAVGLAQGAIDMAVEYARERVQFGKPIISFQAVQHMLADMATQTEAARALVYAVSRHIDGGAKDVSKAAAMSKYFPSDVAMKVTTDAVQILGGYGYMRDYPAEKMMRDAKILQIFEGTNQIQRNIVGQALNKEYGKKNR
ncbi:MAG: acyl-CoA dehydrogenase family protein [Deltaproteobacteria bacterium]|nr:acyl-CoA dehydrogenase family protein [Deltaproteobacteria bacterium]